MFRNSSKEKKKEKEYDEIKDRDLSVNLIAKEKKPSPLRIRKSPKKKNNKTSEAALFHSIMHSTEDILELMKLVDGVNRNMIHRAALSLEPDLIEKMVEPLIKAKSEIINRNSGDGNEIKILINKKDKFGYTPFLCSCFPHTSNKGINENRLRILQIFLEKCDADVDVNIFAVETLWTPLFWVTYHNEEKCVRYLLDKGAIFWLPDKKGYLPIDIAGKTNSTEVLKLLLERMLNLIEENDPNRKGELNDRNQVLAYEMKPGPWTNSCYIQTVTAYWLCFMKDCAGLERLLRIRPMKVMPEYPLVKNKNKNCFHMAALAKSFDALELLIKYLEAQYLHIYESYRYGDLDSIRVPGNFGADMNMLPLSEYEAFTMKKVHKRPDLKLTFMSSVQAMKVWYGKKILKISKVAKDIPELSDGKMQIEVVRATRLFDSQDKEGSTPLHYAIFHEAPEITNRLLELGSSKTCENELGWKPLDFSRNSIKSIIEKYTGRKLFSNLLSFKKNITRNSVTMQSPESQNRSGPVSPDPWKNPFVNSNSFKEIQKSFDELAENFVHIPEYVIRFRIPQKQISDGLLPFQKKGKVERRVQMQITIVDHLIKIFVERGFEVDIFESLDGSAYYAMISMDTETLEKKCEEKGLEMRRADNKMYETFYRREGKTSLFEPFRPRQKQEIISSLILSAEAVIPIDLLVANKHVDQNYFMHFPDVQEKIRKYWRTDWLSLKIPQPFPETINYIWEFGNDKKFPGINLLQQYFGERIAIFFAWMSFNTIFFFPIGILGIVFMILTYTVKSSEALSIILIIYLFLISLCVTVISEIWKRRSFEINAKWGTLHLMNEDSSKLEERKKFVGMEQVVFSKRKTTKMQKKAYVVIGYAVYLTVSILLGVLYIVIFFLLDAWKDKYDESEYKTYIQFGIGSINSFCISIFNFFFFKFANK